MKPPLAARGRKFVGYSAGGAASPTRRVGEGRARGSGGGPTPPAAGGTGATGQGLPTRGTRLAGIRERRCDALLLEHLGYLRRHARQLTCSAPDAEDLVQDTCLRVLRFSHRFRPGTNFRAWVLRILRNTRNSDLRRRRPTVLLGETDDVARETPLGTGSGLDPHEALARRDEARLVREILDGLPPCFADALWMQMQGHSYRETSERLGVPMGTVMSRLHRARRSAGRALTERAGAREARSSRRRHDGPAR